MVLKKQSTLKPLYRSTNVRREALRVIAQSLIERRARLRFRYDGLQEQRHLLRALKARDPGDAGTLLAWDFDADESYMRIVGKHVDWDERDRWARLRAWHPNNVREVVP